MIYLEIFWVFLKVGLFAFGGGYGLIAMIKQEVMAKGWISEEMLYNFIGVSESTPGAISINLATFVGTAQGGAIGAILATIGVVLPSFVIILLIMKVYKRFSENKYARGLMQGIQPVVLALIIVTGLFIIINNFVIGFGNWSAPISFDYRSIIIMGVLGLVLLISDVALKKRISPIFIILLSACIGMAIY